MSLGGSSGEGTATWCAVRRAQVRHTSELNWTPAGLAFVLSLPFLGLKSQWAWSRVQRTITSPEVLWGLAAVRVIWHSTFGGKKIRGKIIGHYI